MKLTLFLILLSVLQPILGQSSPSSSYGITHADIRDAILTLFGAVRDQTEKLERHEARERHLGDSLTRVLSAIDSRTRGEEKNMDNLAVLMAKMDERLRKVEEMIMQRDDRERIQLQKVIDVSNTVKSILEDKVTKLEAPSNQPKTATPTALDPELSKQLYRLRKKTDTIEEVLQTRLAHMSNEVKIVGEKLDARGDRLEGLSLATMESVGKIQTSEADKLRAASANLVLAEGKWRQFLQDAEAILTQVNVNSQSITDQVSHFKNDSAAILLGIENLDISLENVTRTLSVGVTLSTTAVEEEKALFEGQTLLLNQIFLKQNSTLNTINEIVEKQAARFTSLEANTNESLRSLEKQSKTAQQNVSSAIQDSVRALSQGVQQLSTDLGQKLNESTKLIQDQIADAAQTSETLAETVERGYTDLTKEIQGLQNVERVMLDTADSVLDTKRRLEYAVQQILLELGETVRRQTGDLNHTLARKVDDVTLSVLANQTIAMANMTSKIERELGQVWRQIGVLHQSATQSQAVLQKVEQQTASHVAGTLQSLTNMDSKVLTINSRMSQVDENLNYLLGRMLLVVQEFNEIRGGLGEKNSTQTGNTKTTQGKNPDSDTTDKAIEQRINPSDV